MPDRIYRNRLVIWLIVGLLICCLALAIAGLLATANLGRTLDAQKTSSARGECRAQVTNKDEDIFRHRIGLLITEPDQVKRRALAMEIVDEEPTQAKIDAQCPAPLVSTTTTTTKEK